MLFVMQLYEINDVFILFFILGWLEQILNLALGAKLDDSIIVPFCDLFRNS